MTFPTKMSIAIQFGTGSFQPYNQELWKLKYFSMQKYNLQKYNPLRETLILQDITTLL